MSPSTVYDDLSGVLISSTDENNATTAYTYDEMKRLKTIAYPSGPSSSNPTGTETFVYADVSSTNPSASFTYTATLSPTESLTGLVNLDGLGRTLHNTLTSDPDGNDVADTAYDALGRVYTVTNPHRSGSNPTDGTTTYAYDVTNRPSSIKYPDGKTRLWTYAGNVTTIQDEIGSKWQQTTDALGRLSEVMEPDPTTGSPAFETDYAYDLQNDLQRVDQWGGAHGNAGDRVRTFVYDGVGRLLSATNPESGTTTYSYLTYPNNTALCSGVLSNVCSRTDARGLVTSYTYDALGRVTAKNYPNAGTTTPSVTYNYDTAISGWAFPDQTFPSGQPVSQANLKGRLSWERNTNATIVYGYDPMGRVTLKSVCTLVNCASSDHYDMHLAYDNLGDVTFSDLGRDAVQNAQSPNAGYYYGGLTMGYSTAALLTSGTADTVDSTHPAAILSNMHYNPLGINSQRTFGGVLDLSDAYMSRGWLTDRAASVPVDSLTRTDHIDYYGTGDMKDLVDSLLGTTSYVFDRLNRLSSFSNPSTAVTYGYDPWANMTAHTLTAGSGYSYTAQMNSKNQITALPYDGSGAGTMTSDGTNAYSYDAEARLYQVNSGTTYLYDPDGNRVAKQASGAIEEQYLYSPDGKLTTTLGANGKLVRGTLYAGGLHVADYTAGTGAGSGRTEFRLMDTVGSLFVKIDQAGNVLETCNQNPFGESLNCAPGVDYTETHFSDRLTDQESSLNYFTARSYSSTLARFTVPDSSQTPAAVPYGDLGTPQSLNLYTYVLNNPLSNVDFDGHSCTGNDATSTINEGNYQVGSNSTVSQTTNVSVEGNCFPLLIPTTPDNHVTATIALQTSRAPSNPCTNSTLTAAGTTAQQQIATAQSFIAAGSAGGSTAGPLGSAAGSLYGYYSAVETGGPNDIKDLPGPGFQNRVGIDAGNISFGVTCPFGATACQVGAGLAQFGAALFGKATFGSPRTFMDSPGDNASIKIGQAMRAAGCHG